MKRKETKEYRKIFDEARDIIELLSHTTSYLQEAVLQELLDASIYHDRSYVLLYSDHESLTSLSPDFHFSRSITAFDWSWWFLPRRSIKISARFLRDLSLRKGGNHILRPSTNGATLNVYIIHCETTNFYREILKDYKSMESCMFILLRWNIFIIRW